MEALPIITNISIQRIRDILEEVTDPEIPVLTITDLGIVKDISVLPGKGAVSEIIQIIITPTYSGCPAMDMISMNIKLALAEHGYMNVKIISRLSPAWTTDWMSEAGKKKLQAYGIAPPKGNAIDEKMLTDHMIACPQCGSKNTKLVSSFGSTACKALFRCNECGEPFDYFKCY